MTWSVLEVPGGQHVVPDEPDTVEHVTNSACPCRPKKTKLGCEGHSALMIRVMYTHRDEADRIARGDG